MAYFDFLLCAFRTMEYKTERVKYVRQVKYEIQHSTGDRGLGSTHMSQAGRIVYLRRSHRKFIIVMCMIIEIQDLEGAHKRCPPKEDQH